MIVFISSPYGAVFEEVKDEGQALETALKIARAGARKALEMGHIPLSPVLAFNGVYSESEERQRAIKDSLACLKWCDGVMFVNCKFSQMSAGMVLERDLAKKLDKPTIEFHYEEEKNGDFKL